MSGRRQLGQALVETVIVIPVLFFLVLGALQLVLVAHARVMTEYAAFCAARAGIVHDADWNVMRNAALIASLPLYARTDEPERFLATWAKVKTAAEITEQVDTGVATLERLGSVLLGKNIEGLAPDVSLVEVAVTQPSSETFAAARSWQQAREAEALDRDAQGPLAYPTEGREIDFDDAAFLAEHPDAARLAVEVRVLYPLRIPFVSKLIFELWLAQQLLDARSLEGSLTDWARFRTKVRGGAANGEYLDEAVAQAGSQSSMYTTSQWTRELGVLRYVAEHYGVYLLPMHASYAMPMQSNLFESKRKEPVWFSLD